jgi:hypothetical protein
MAFFRDEVAGFLPTVLAFPLLSFSMALLVAAGAASRSTEVRPLPETLDLSDSFGFVLSRPSFLLYGLAAFGFRPHMEGVTGRLIWRRQRRESLASERPLVSRALQSITSMAPSSEQRCSASTDSPTGLIRSLFRSPAYEFASFRF